MSHNERMSTVLSLRAVTKRYWRRGPWVLSGADLSLEGGSLTSIEGANGSGKSTLLRIAAGVTSPSGGTAVVPSKVGYVPERQAGRCKFSGAEYLTHMGRIRGLDPDRARRTGAELLTRLGVRPGPEVSWNDLSKGNRQKVVVAQAFLGRLDAVILDEPYSGLDDEARAGTLPTHRRGSDPRNLCLDEQPRHSCGHKPELPDRRGSPRTRNRRTFDEGPNRASRAGPSR